jgi:hypothetical protein
VPLVTPCGNIMEGVKGIASFHGDDPPDAMQSAGSFCTFCELQIRRTGRQPFDAIFILRLS